MISNIFNWRSPPHVVAPQGASEKFELARRDPPPRVRFAYDDPDRPGQTIELPFVVGVIADLSGDAPGVTRTDFPERLFVDLDAGDFDTRMAELLPGLWLSTSRETIEDGLIFRSLADFKPKAIARQLPNATTLNGAQLSERVADILSAPAFRSLEASWRGLRYLVDAIPAGAPIRVRVLNASRMEIARDFRSCAGNDVSQSRLFKHLHDDVYGVRGAAPFACVVADFAFSHTPDDIAVLRGLARLAEATQAPVLTGIAPRLFGAARWSDVASINPDRSFDGADHDAWRGLRDEPSSRFIGLCGPRFRARSSYPAFAESEPLWMNAAYAMAGNAIRSFAAFGWAARIRGVHSGGEVNDLPATIDDGASADAPGLLETTFTEKQEALWSNDGLILALPLAQSGKPVFCAARSLHRPQPRETADATAEEQIGARLPYLFAASRLVHHLRCRVRDGGDAHGLQRWLDGFVRTGPRDVAILDGARRPLSAATVSRDDSDNNSGRSVDVAISPLHQCEGIEGLCIRFRFWLSTLRRPADHDTR